MDAGAIAAIITATGGIGALGIGVTKLRGETSSVTISQQTQILQDMKLLNDEIHKSLNEVREERDRYKKERNNLREEVDKLRHEVIKLRYQVEQLNAHNARARDAAPDDYAD